MENGSPTSSQSSLVSQRSSATGYAPVSESGSTDSEASGVGAPIVASPSGAPNNTGRSPEGEAGTRRQIMSEVKAGRRDMAQAIVALRSMGIDPMEPKATDVNRTSDVPVGLAGVESGRFNARQAAEMRADADYFVSIGAISRADADTLLKEEGLFSESSAAEVPQAVREIDSFYPPCNPVALHLPPTSDPKFDQARRTWSSEGRFSSKAAETFWSSVENAEYRYQTMDPRRRADYSQSGNLGLRAVYGDQLESKLSVAKQLLDDLETKTPGIKTRLVKNGSLEDSIVVEQLIRQGELLMQRKNGFRKPGEELLTADGIQEMQRKKR